MRNYLAAVWKCRHFWLSLVRMDLSTRYRRSVLGLGWSLLQPLAMTATICLALYVLTGRSVRETAAYVMSGLVTWNYLLSCALHGCRCLHGGESYIRQYPAPLAIYPLRTALGAMVHFLIALGVVVVLTWILNGSLANLPALATLPLSLVALLLLGWAIALLAGFANVFFQDTQHLCEIGMQLLFYATPILYEVQLLEARGLGWLARANPVFSVLELVRQPIRDGAAPSAFTLLAAGATVLAAVGAAALTLARHERRLIFRL